MFYKGYIMLSSPYVKVLSYYQRHEFSWYLQKVQG